MFGGQRAHFVDLRNKQTCAVLEKLFRKRLGRMTDASAIEASRLLFTALCKQKLPCEALFGFLGHCGTWATSSGDISATRIVIIYTRDKTVPCRDKTSE